MKNTSAIICSLVVILPSILHGEDPSMTGSEISVKLESTTVYAGPESGVVGEGIEISNLASFPTNRGFSIDFGSNTILIKRKSGTLITASTGFNGMVIDEVGDSLPPIFGAHLTSSEVPAFSQERITTSSGQIRLNFESIRFQADDEILITVAFGPSLSLTDPENGSLSGAGEYLLGASAEVQATPNAGFLFQSWTGDASGNENPLSLTMDADKNLGALFQPDYNDDDSDGITNHREIVIYGTNPALADSDDDGFLDLFEINTGFDPNSESSTPDAQSRIRTAIEFEFSAAVGSTYRIEASEDLQEWSIIEDDIVGNGGFISRLYSINGQTVRVFRARKN